MTKEVLEIVKVVFEEIHLRMPILVKVINLKYELNVM